MEALSGDFGQDPKDLSYINVEVQSEHDFQEVTRRRDRENPSTEALLNYIRLRDYSSVQELVEKGMVDAQLALYFTLILSKSKEAYEEVLRGCRKGAAEADFSSFEDYYLLVFPGSDELEELRDHVLD